MISSIFSPIETLANFVWKYLFPLISSASARAPLSLPRVQPSAAAAPVTAIAPEGHRQVRKVATVLIPSSVSAKDYRSAAALTSLPSSIVAVRRRQATGELLRRALRVDALRLRRRAIVCR